MVKNLVINDKIYHLKSDEKQKRIIKKYSYYLNGIIRGFPKTNVKINKIRKFDQRIEVKVEGPEEVFIYNLLKSELGTIKKFEKVAVGDIYKGSMIEVGKFGFGIFIDCGIFQPKSDVLISLYSIRKQLCGDKKVSLTEIIKKYEFIDFFPVYIKIINKDAQKVNLEGIFADKTINFYKKLAEEELEAIFISGETKGQIKKALLKTGHLRDIITLNRFGFLEHTVLFKQNTEAPGILADIGKYLKNCRISAIRSTKIKKLFKT